MKYVDPKRPPQNPTEGDLDRILDAALAKYAAAEPRGGLEQRILANLRSVEVPLPKRAWWPWGFSVATLAIVVAIITPVWKARNSSHPLVTNRPNITNPAAAAIPPQIARIAPSKKEHGRRHTAAVRRTEPVLAAAPKLDQFPSPQPLTEQERILAGYVAQFHDQAVLVASIADQQIRKDRNEMLRQDAPSLTNFGDQITNR